jgi:hypothetical protein
VPSISTYTPSSLVEAAKSFPAGAGIRNQARPFRTHTVGPSADWVANTIERPIGMPATYTTGWSQKTNPVYAAKFTHSTSRTENKLNRGQAHAAIAAALLRQLYAVVTTGQKWDAAIAADGRSEVMEPAA